jgi:hypothetical protein
VLGLYICATPPSYPSTTSSSFFFLARQYWSLNSGPQAC